MAGMSGWEQHSSHWEFQSSSLAPRTNRAGEFHSFRPPTSERLAERGHRGQPECSSSSQSRSHSRCLQRHLCAAPATANCQHVWQLSIRRFEQWLQNIHTSTQHINNTTSHLDYAPVVSHFSSIVWLQQFAKLTISQHYRRLFIKPFQNQCQNCGLAKRSNTVVTFKIHRSQKDAGQGLLNFEQCESCSDYLNLFLSPSPVSNLRAPNRIIPAPNLFLHHLILQ